MATFTAFNLEPEESDDDEIDNTKEIQIEEALKLYQSALKLQSQGPPLFPQAFHAYDSLLRSEIFKYPEALSDSQKDGTAVQDWDLNHLLEPAEEDALIPLNGNDSAPSTVPQIIYLIYRNYGELLLKDIAGRLQMPSFQALPANDQFQTKLGMRTYAKEALQKFSDALERDDTDLELWRTTAKLSGDTFRSARLMRFCLESVLDQDSDLSAGVFGLNLDETFARKELLHVLQDLSDNLSLTQTREQRESKHDLHLAGIGSDGLESVPELPRPRTNVPPIRTICPTSRTWAGVGWAFMQALSDVELGLIQFAPGTGFIIQLPDEIATQRLSSSAPNRAPFPTHPNAPVLLQRTTEQPGLFVNTSAIPAQDVQSSIATSGISTKSQQPDAMPSSQVVLSPELQSAHPESSTMTLPTRKRSSASAGNDETIDGSRSRSKRIRARESIVEGFGLEENSAMESGKAYQGDTPFWKRTRHILDVDRYALNLMRHLHSKVDIDLGVEMENIEDLTDLVHFKTMTPKHPYTEADKVMMSDLTAIGSSWTREKAKVVSSPDSSTHDDGNTSSNLDIFLDHLRNPGKGITNRPTLSGDEELSEFIQRLQDKQNPEWFGIHQICFRWLEALLSPKTDKPSDRLTMYTRYLWPADLKQVVAQMIVGEDEYIFGLLRSRLHAIESRVQKASIHEKMFLLSPLEQASVEMAETLYELHLDIYSLITSPSSVVDIETRIKQQDRLDRLGRLTHSYVTNHRKASKTFNDINQLALRHLWTATLHAKAAEDTSREHVLLCLGDLRNLLRESSSQVILLPNNAVMPEISMRAIDQELSKVNTMDYFLKIFNADQGDSFTVIESLEPILDRVASEGGRMPDTGSLVSNDADSQHRESTESALSGSSSLLEETVKLLDRGSTSLKLFLWRRLREAYKSIGYKSKVVCCYLRSVILIMRETTNQKPSTQSDEDRQSQLLKSLSSLNELLLQVLTSVENSPDALEEVDYELEKISLAAIASLLRCLYGYALAEEYRVSGLALPGTPNEEPVAPPYLELLTNILVRAHVLQYILLKDCLQQNNAAEFPGLAETLAEYLGSVHHALGMRSQCKASSRIFLKFALQEFVGLGVSTQYRFDLAQVIYDLYGWKLAPEVQIHDCSPLQLERSTALLLVDFVLRESRGYNIKDLVKSDLRLMIDKMQLLIGAPQSSTGYTLNRRLLNTFLKSPIDPMKLYKYVKGVGDLSMVPVRTESAKTAEKGWYFLFGHIALSRFKSQQRFSASPTDDLEIAVAFFKQDLEHGTEKWETWYRLAQTYDAKLYEDLQWGAEQINNQRPALAVMQRHAIHCYGMAVATALRNDDESPKSSDIKSQLFTDFGMRIYASSREPLSMDAFSLDEFNRHYSSDDKPLYKSRPFRDMQLYAAWNFSSILLKNAIAFNPNRWINYFQLGKVLWKMCSRPEASHQYKDKVQVDEVVDALIMAIRSLPECRDSRQEPTLEPHYKLVSIIHKLVYQGRISPSEGSRYLQATPYAQDLPRCNEHDNWETYIIKILERLSKEDKSNWHHRISARAAHVIYDSSKEFHAAMGARHQFSQQIFTKTMVLQVWKPENEMVGRHFVYTTRYVQFFMTLLLQLNDRVNIDALVKRVRKKAGDFFKFNALWEEICTAYLDLLRRQGHIPTSHDDAIFGNIGYDEFTAYSTRISDWISSNRENHEIQPLFDVMSTANELKSYKVNSGLMRLGPFDDLIVDAYAVLYEKVHPIIFQQISGEENRERMSINHLTTFDGNAESAQNASWGSPSTAMLVVAPLNSPTPALPRPRPVTKRDILRKAETAILRPTVSAAPVLQSRPNQEGTLSAPLPIREDLMRDVADATGGSSVPGSVHDSADDESELSEVDESRLAKPPLFPGLVRASEADDSAIQTEDEQASGNEGEDEDGEGLDDLGDRDGSAQAQNKLAEAGEERTDGLEEAQ